MSFIRAMFQKLVSGPEVESLSPAMAGSATNLLSGLRMSAVNVAERDAATATSRPDRGSLSQAIASATDLLDALHVGTASGPSAREAAGRVHADDVLSGWLQRPVSDDTMRLALRLASERQTANVRVLLFAGIRAGQAVDGLLMAMMLGLHRVQQGPLLVLHFEDSSVAGTDNAFEAFPVVSVAELLATPGSVLDATPSEPVTVVRVRVGGPEDVARLASVEFARALKASRDRFSGILCGAAPLPQSVTPLVLAKHCDGAVLSVPAQGTSVPEMRAIQELLDQAQAPVIGFVLESVQRAAPEGRSRLSITRR